MTTHAWVMIGLFAAGMITISTLAIVDGKRERERDLDHGDRASRGNPTIVITAPREVAELRIHADTITIDVPEEVADLAGIDSDSTGTEAAQDRRIIIVRNNRVWPCRILPESVQARARARFHGDHATTIPPHGAAQLVYRRIPSRWEVTDVGLLPQESGNR